MLISKKWLSEFVSLPKNLSDADLAKTVTLSTVEVESFSDQAAALNRVVVGLVTAVTPHPNADRLRVCQVDVGGRVTQIVCGGTNVREGLKVAVALPGSRVRWHGEGDLVEIQKTKLRGEESEGMICAGVELGLETGEGDHEIVELDTAAITGTPLAEVFHRDDVIFDIEHKSLTNRPDLMGHYGMARELSALYDVPLAPFAPAAIAPGTATDLSVTIEDPTLCARYMAVVVEGVEVAPSPAWLRDRLTACGVRSINNLVDVTNYVMLECGQPMHAFDADAVGGTKISIDVRMAAEGEAVACLDGKTYVMRGGELLVTDGERATAIAGVMGGAASAVGASTTRVVLESANFSAVSVRKTSTKLALRSESSARFEKSLDAEQCDSALRRAVELIRKLCPNARVASKVVDAYPSPAKPTVVELAPERVRGLLGADIDASEIVGILSRLGFSVLSSANLKITVPSWRATKDVRIAEDVVEEVARIYGYDRIPSALPPFVIAPPAQDRVRRLARLGRHALAERFAATEAYRYAFTSAETLTSLGLDVAAHLELANPLSKERPYLVRSLVPNLLEGVRENQRATDPVRLFESARAFLGDRDGAEMGEGTKSLPMQPTMLAAVVSGKGIEQPFWEAKEMALGALASFGYAATVMPAAMTSAWAHPTRSADLFVGDTHVGFVGEIAPSVADAFGLDHRAAAFELNLDVVAALPATVAAYRPVPTQPDLKRDLAFVVADRAAFADIERALRSASSLVVDVELFDVYRGKGVEEGKKSLAVHLTLRASDRTLTSEEADAEVATCVGVLGTAFGATMRA